MSSSSPPPAEDPFHRRQRDDDGDGVSDDGGDLEPEESLPAETASSSSSSSSSTSMAPSSYAWVRVLDSQAVGGCRGDERLKPILLPNLNFGVQDKFFSHLSQHFEAFEIGLLVRCLCAPLVSVRVGKVDKQGALLYPNSSRGHLNLYLLPSSSMRLSFVGDDGSNEQLAFLHNSFEDPVIELDELVADSSGRTFQLKLDSSSIFYWCAEKMRQHGFELLAKMNDLLEGRPTLSQLTGISSTRLDAFATHFQAFVLSSSTGELTSTTTLEELFSSSSMPAQSSSTASKVSRSRVSPVYQASLSPRSSTSFKDGAPRSSTIRILGREKSKRRTECQFSLSSSVSSEQNDPAGLPIKPTSTLGCDDEFATDNGNISGISSGLPSGFSLSPYKPPSLSPVEGSATTSLFMPCYCPMYPATALPMSSPFVPLPSPPLTAVFSTAENQLPMVPTDLESSDLLSLTFPALTQDPLVHVKYSAPLLPVPCAEFPTFTPLMSDPIVHIPVLDVCSSGPSYFVSAGPATVPLHSTMIKPFIPETESLVERSARETIMRLIASAPSGCGPLLCSFSEVNDQSSSNQLIGTGSYVDTVAIGISAMSLQLSMQETAAGCENEADAVTGSAVDKQNFEEEDEHKNNL